MASADLVGFTIACAAFAGVWLALDAYTLSWLFARLGTPTRWLDMIRYRGASYLFLVASLHAANAALVALIQRRTGAPLARVTASMGMYYLGDLTALCSVAFVASLGVTGSVFAYVRPILGAVSLGLLGFFAVAHLLRERLVRIPLLGLIAELGPAEICALVSLRAAFYGTFVLFVWITLPGFQVELSLGAVAARMPIVMGIGALPITPAGLGTTQAAMVALFDGVADSTRVLAYSVAYALALVAIRLPIGAVLAPRVLGAPREEGA
jgi:uncharacterized membrane protein YbhN (UPF0104 family)